MLTKSKRNYDAEDATQRTHETLRKHARQNYYERYRPWIPRLVLQYPLREMRAEYTLEQISYFTQEGLEKTQVVVIDGHIQTLDGNVYTTNGEQMVVMDGRGNVFTYPKERGVVHHSSFFGGGNLAFAGLWEVESGQITAFKVYSGHYQPTLAEESSWEHRMWASFWKSGALTFDSELYEYMQQHSQIKRYRLLHHPKDAWHTRCSHDSVLRLPCLHMRCLGCMSLSSQHVFADMVTCLECNSTWKRLVLCKLIGTNDRLGVPPGIDLQKFSQQITNVFGGQFVTNGFWGFLSNYCHRLNTLTGKETNVLLTGGPSYLTRGIGNELCEKHIMSKVVFIGEACGGGKYPFSEVVKCFRWLTPNHDVPSWLLEKVRHKLTVDGYQIACD